MIYLAKGIGILVGCIGLFFTILPDQTKKFFQFIKQGNRAYGIGIARIVIAAILLLVASQAQQPITVLLLAVIILLSGIFVFILGPDKVREWIVYWEEGSPLILRLLGTLSFCFGALIFFAV